MLVGMEAVLCWAVVKWVPYTEIDWEAYMQEVDGYRGGERDYLQIRGGTGPLVYPAGFLYLYDGLRAMAGGGGGECESDGSDSDDIIRRVQHMFCVLYVLHAAVVLQLYTTVARRCATALSSRHSPQDKLPLSDDAATTTAAHVVWMWRVAMGICCASKRMHSIFVLRLFNDAPAMFLLYLSTLLFSRNCWRSGCVLYSLGVSIKMNVLLFAPGLLLLLLQATPNVYETILCLSICAMVQLVLGAPFLLTYPVSYIRKAFEFDRVFFYKWTVNWKVCTIRYTIQYGSD
jgi:alpha-1,3-mannosyltransferase